MSSRRARILSGAGLAAGLLAACYRLSWRDRCAHWGATPDEVASTLDGDDLMPDADVVTTRAILIDAPPGRIWPWLVQMGSGRAGSYSYDWIENLFGLDMHSADVVLQQFQDVRVGDAFPIGSGTMRVEVIQPGRLLVTQVPEWHWVRIFRLTAAGGSTRLVLRNRIAYPGMNAASRACLRLIGEAGGLVMERKMLLGIKERAESDDPAIWPGRPRG